MNTAKELWILAIELPDGSYEFVDGVYHSEQDARIAGHIRLGWQRLRRVFVTRAVVADAVLAFDPATARPLATEVDA